MKRNGKRQAPGEAPGRVAEEHKTEEVEVDGAQEAADFVTALNDDDTQVVYDGLLRFVQASRGVQAEDTKSAVNQYLNLSPESSEIFQWWEDIRTGRAKPQKGSEGSFTAALLDALATILFMAHPEKFAASRTSLVQNLLHLTNVLNSFLASIRDQKLLRCFLKLLVAMVNNGPGVARELYARIPFEEQNMLRLADKGDIGAGKGKTRDGKTRYGSTRHRFLQLTAALLQHGDVTLKKKILDPKGVAMAALRRVKEDPNEMLAYFFDVLNEFVLQDPAIGRKTKINLFAQPIVLETMLLPLYQSDDASIREIVHKFFKAAFVTPETSIFPSKSDLPSEDAVRVEDSAFYKRVEEQLGRRNRTISFIARNLNVVDNKLQRELVLELLQLDDTLMQAFLNSTWGKLSLDPRPSFNWVRNIVFVRNLLAFTPPRLQSVVPNLAAVKIDQLSDAVLSCALPGAHALPKPLLSKGVQHFSSLVVINSLDLLSQLLERLHAVYSDAATLPNVNMEQLQETVALKLVQRIPDVNVILHLTIGTSMEDTKQKDTHTWQPKEADWVRLKAARALVWYGKVAPQLLLGKLSVEKLIPIYSEDPSSVSLAAHVSIAKMLEAVGTSTVAWTKAEAIFRVWQLRPFCLHHTAAIDSVLEAIFTSVVSTSSFTSSRGTTERAHANAWARATYTRDDANYVASVITATVAKKPFPSCDDVLRVAFEQIEARSTPKEAQVVLHRVIMELIHSMADLSTFVPVLAEIGLVQKLSSGKSIMSYINLVLGTSLEDTIAMEGSIPAHFVLEALNWDLHAATGKPSSIPPMRVARSIIGQALQSGFDAKGKRTELFSDEQVGVVRTELFKIIEDLSTSEVWQIALLVSRALGTFLKGATSHQASANPAVGLCMDLLDMCVEQDPECIVESLSGHSQLRDMKSLPADVQLRVAQLFDVARSAKSLFTAFIGTFTNWVGMFVANPTEDVAACLLLSRNCFVNEHVKDPSSELLDQIASVHVDSDNEQPLARALVLYALTHGPADARTLSRLLATAANEPEEDVDSAFAACCEGIVLKHTLSPRECFAGNFLNQPQTIEALSVLWTKPSAARIHALNLLAGQPGIAEAALQYIAEAKDVSPYAEFLAFCPRSILDKYSSPGLWKRLLSHKFKLSGDLHSIQSLLVAQTLAPGISSKLAIEIFTRCLEGNPTLEVFQLIANLLIASDTPTISLFDRFAGRIAGECFHMAIEASSADVVSSALEVVHQIAQAAQGRAQGRVDAGLLTQLFEKEQVHAGAAKAALALLDSGLAFAAEHQVSSLLSRSDLHGTPSLERLWLAYSKRLPNVACASSHFNKLVQSYTGTMSEADCIRRYLIQLYEEERAGSLKSMAFAIGEKASSFTGSLEVSCDQSVDVNDPVVLRSFVLGQFEWIFSELDFSLSESSKFPIFRALKPADELPFTMKLAKTAATLYVEETSAEEVEETSVKRNRATSGRQTERAKKRVKTGNKGYEELFSSDDDSSSDEGDSENENNDELMEEDEDEGQESEEEMDLKSTKANVLQQELESLAQQEKFSEALDPSYAMNLLDLYFTSHAILADLPPLTEEILAEQTEKENMEEHEDEDAPEHNDRDEEGGEEGKEEEDGEEAPPADDQEKLGDKLTNVFSARKVLDSKMISYCIWALSSLCVEVRRKAATCLQRFGQLVLLDRLFRDKLQVLLVLRFVRNALVDGPETRISGIHCNFLCQALEIVTKPSHTLFKVTYRFLLRQPALRLDDVPMFYQTFSSGTPTYRGDRLWLIRTVEQGTRTWFDVDVLVKRHALGLFMSFIASPMGDAYMYKQVLDVLVKVTRSGSTAVRQLLKVGGLTWTLEMLAQVSVRPEISPVSVVDLCEILFHSAQATVSRVNQLNLTRAENKDEVLVGMVDAELMGAAVWLLQIAPGLLKDFKHERKLAFCHILNALVMWSGVEGGLDAMESESSSTAQVLEMQHGMLQLPWGDLATFIAEYGDLITGNVPFTVGVLLIILRNRSSLIKHENTAAAMPVLLRWMLDVLLHVQPDISAHYAWILSKCVLALANWFSTFSEVYPTFVKPNSELEARFHALWVMDYFQDSAQNVSVQHAIRENMLQARLTLAEYI